MLTAGQNLGDVKRGSGEVKGIGEGVGGAYAVTWLEGSREGGVEVCFSAIPWMKLSGNFCMGNEKRVCTLRLV